MSERLPLRIPPVDLRAGYQAHKAEIDAAVQRVLESGHYILGREVEAFEAEFAAYVGVRYAIGVANGTDALELALRAAGVGPGDLVFTVSHTAVATVAAIERSGAMPVLVDIEPDTFTMDPHALERALATVRGGRPAAVVPVHLYGHPADMTAITAIARRHGLVVIEDGAQAHGAVWRERRVGAWGHLGAFSFYPTKNLGALGDGGAVVTDDPALAERVRLLRQYGWRQRYISEVPGVNSRLDELQAAVLRVKLRHLDAANARRRAVAGLYTRLLADLDLVLPIARPEAEHVYHQYVVRTPCREALQAWLAADGIGTLIHYPEAVHQQPAYSGRLPLADGLHCSEQAAAQVLSLPMYPELSDDQVHHIATTVRRWSAQNPRGICL
jgi:dTDP-4-amino-4,6-dideoxygalactose transaminase